LLGVISDETGSGSLVFATSPTLVTPVLGVATATSINKLTLTQPATGATLTLADNSSLVTSGAFSTTLTSTGVTTVTLPTTGTLATRAGTETLTNKSLVDATTSIVDDGDATKKMQFQLSGLTTATTRTLTVPDASGTIMLASGLSTNSIPYWTGSALASGNVWGDGTHTYIGSGFTTFGTYALQVAGDFKTDKIYHSSDRRWKKNIFTLDSALSKVQRLRGVSYDWRKDEFPNKHFSDGRQIGVIAQEVEAVIPELVKTDSDGFKAVEYANLVAYLIEAVKEQQKMIDSQNNEIASLKADNQKSQAEISRMSDMQKQMDALKKQMAGLQDMMQQITPTVQLKK
jgi:hypothetical protein